MGKRFYDPPDVFEGIFNPYDETFGPIMAALQAGEFETAARLTRKLADESGIPERRLVIMQGAPGSGKSTMARKIAEAQPETLSTIFSTDDYWLANPDVYAFDAAKLGQAHRWNEGRVRNAMEHEIGLIIVDNTNVLRSYVLPYEQLAVQHGYSVEYCRVDPGLDECLRRNALRSEDRIIPEDVVRELHAKMETLGPGELS